MKYILILLLFSLASCSWFRKKSSDPTPIYTLPPITQSGAGTFGCLVNGELMVSVNLCTSTCPPNPYFDPSVGFLVGGFMDTSADGYRSQVSLEFDNIHGEGVYNLDTIANSTHAERLKHSLRVYKYTGVSYSMSTIDTGTYCHGRLVITKWQHGQGGFASGTFWFDLYNPAKYADTVRVRDGRFDVAL